MKIIVNGVFDLLHLGHINLLKHAKSYPASFVYVLIDSDIRTKELKGVGRPIQPQQERKIILESLRYVDGVDIFWTNEHLEMLIKNFEPDIMVKGSEYRGKQIIGSQYCKEIYFYERRDNNSTTKKIEDFAARRSMYRL